MKNLLNKRIKDIGGITLIALVITIVVLIIIASVAIGIAVGQNGIITRAKESGKLYTNAQEGEKDTLNNYDFQLTSTRDASDTSPIGTIIAYMGGTTAPTNYLACDGSELNIADYPELAAQFETGFGGKNYFGGDGTSTFKVPDLQGEFLRGTGTNSHTNQGSGASVGIHQDATQHFPIGTMSNALLAWPNVIGTNYMTGTNQDSSIGTVTYARGSSMTTSTWAAAGVPQFTSRPTNTSVLYCIKAK